MIRAEEEISQDGVPVAHDHILIQQSRLGNGIDLNLENGRREESLCCK